MKHLTTIDYLQRVRTLGFNSQLNRGTNEIFVSTDNRIILSVHEDKPYRMDSNWSGLSEYLCNNSIVRGMLVEALLILTTRYANTPIADRGTIYDVFTPTGFTAVELAKYQRQIQMSLELEGDW